MLGRAGLCASKTGDADSPKELAMAQAKKAKRAQKAGHNAEAYLLYSQAAAIEPRNRSYHARMEVLQTRAAAESKPQPRAGSGQDLPPLDLSPDDVFDSLTEKEMAAARPLNWVPSLKAKSGKLDFDLAGDPRVLFDKVTQAFGLDTPFTTATSRAAARQSASMSAARIIATPCTTSRPPPGLSSYPFPQGC